MVCSYRPLGWTYDMNYTYISVDEEHAVQFLKLNLILEGF